MSYKWVFWKTVKDSMSSEISGYIISLFEIHIQFYINTVSILRKVAPKNPGLESVSRLNWPISISNWIFEHTSLKEKY